MVEKITFMRRVSGALLLSTALLWIVLVDQSQNTSLTTSSVALRALAMVPRRQPVVYAFVNENPLGGGHNNNNTNAKQHLWWQSVWMAAGWDAKFLTLDDAQRHPDFGIFQSVIGESLPFGHQDEKLRYYRWLAMSLVATQEGVAWLTDTTAIAPLWSANQLPTTATLTDFTVRCAPIPPQQQQQQQQQQLETLSSSSTLSSACLMSGSKKEWERMSIALLDSIQRHHTLAYHNSHHHHQQQQQHSLGQQQQQRSDSLLVDEETMVPPLWSESLALEEIVSFANPTGRPMARRDNGAVTTTTIAIHQHPTTTTTIDCASLANKIAIFFHPQQQQKDKQWLSAWGQQCSGIRYYNNPDTIIGQLPRPIMENQQLD